MFSGWKHGIKITILRDSWLSHRCLSVKQTAIALRPLYFRVHPDLFSQYPTERLVNEESLKLLHEYITSQRKVDNVKPTRVVFYVRPPQNIKSIELKEVRIHLSTKNVRGTVEKVLEKCGLPLNYIHTVEKEKSDEIFPRPVYRNQTFYYGTAPPPEEEKPKREIVTLRSWFRNNLKDVRESEEVSKTFLHDVDTYREKIIQGLELKELRWESLWGIRYCRSCLKMFYRLYEENPENIREYLKGRRLVFANTAGISLLGDVILSCEDVRSDWLKLLKNVKAYDSVLERLPLMEVELSRLLNNIQVTRRKRHYITMANKYELYLGKLLNTLRHNRDATLKWLEEEDLSEIQMVVESEAGPLAVSKCGQFLIPASLPGSMIVEFIAKNKKHASVLLRDNVRYVEAEDKVIEECRQILQLKELTKDENITPQQMISCCEKLISEYWKLGVLLTNTRINVSNYYSMLEDGKIIIPWDCIMDTDGV
ncbi:hypothetical protein LOTGIDRAFT_192633 [Lottia gigantea]|uniref:DUF4460 domain-containing protein n=1 Tax=Lottia gigantea TaxID=225164 RepID=V3ZZ87_LOTGI|nr:hypothetical protein LOTGIDRAFT_192633 [Lottia gigantea]ESO89737.1 hypothetical protein LOTGIDRAFT_192633 [Lottia gigantea]